MNNTITGQIAKISFWPIEAGRSIVRLEVLIPGVPQPVVTEEQGWFDEIIDKYHIKVVDSIKYQASHLIGAECVVERTDGAHRFVKYVVD